MYYYDFPTSSQVLLFKVNVIVWHLSNSDNFPKAVGSDDKMALKIASLLTPNKLSTSPNLANCCRGKLWKSHRLWKNAPNWKKQSEGTSCCAFRSFTTGGSSTSLWNEVRKSESRKKVEEIMKERKKGNYMAELLVKLLFDTSSR